MRAPNARKRTTARRSKPKQEFEIKTKNCTTSTFNGDCCCNCANLVRINKHPWNGSYFAKGRASETFGYGCAVFALHKFEGTEDKISTVTFSDRLHGMCELHIRNEKIKLKEDVKV